MKVYFEEIEKVFKFIIIFESIIFKMMLRNSVLLDPMKIMIN